MRTIEEILKEGFRHHTEGNLGAAAEIYDKLLGFAPDNPNVLYAYGTLIVGDGRPGLGASLLRKAAESAPKPEYLTNLGIAYKNLGLDESALAAMQDALKLDPDCPVIHSNISGFYVNRGTPELAEHHARKALPGGSPQAKNHLALALLEQGKFAEAWPYYEARWDLPERQKDKRDFKCPKWTGERVRLLAIHGEQGVGDEILYMGCLREVLKRVDRVIVECMPRLKRWFEESLGVKCYGTHSELPEEPDAYIPMGSLPGIVGVPDGKPYMKRRFDPIPGRIGYAWKGGTQKTNKKQRTIQKSDFDFLNGVSVQYGNGPDMIGMGVDELVDAISKCELVVTVCQSAVHVAGAMGVPCWVLVPKACAWRYSPAFGDRMPWYESVRLYRQEETWEPALKRVEEDARRFVLR